MGHVSLSWTRHSVVAPNVPMTTMPMLPTTKIKPHHYITSTHGSHLNTVGKQNQQHAFVNSNTSRYKDVNKQAAPAGDGDGKWSPGSSRESATNVVCAVTPSSFVTFIQRDSKTSAASRTVAIRPLGE